MGALHGARQGTRRVKAAAAAVDVAIATVVLAETDSPVGFALTAGFVGGLRLGIDDSTVPRRCFQSAIVTNCSELNLVHRLSLFSLLFIAANSLRVL